MRRISMLFFFFFVFLSFKFAYALSEVTNCFNYLEAGDYKRAIEMGQRAVKLYPKNFYAYFCLGDSLYHSGELELALINFKEAEKLAFSKEELAQIYNRLGHVYSKKGDLDNALHYYSRVLFLSRELGNKWLEAGALNNIAGIFYSKGDLDRALNYYEQSLKIQNDEKERTATYNNIALIYKDKRDYKKAEEYFIKAIDLGTRVGDYHGVAVYMINLGELYINMENYSRAEEYLTEGLKRILKVGDKYWEATAYEYFGILYAKKKNIKLAKEYFQKAHDLFQSIGATQRAEQIAQFFILLTVSNIFENIENISKSLKEQPKSFLYAGIEVGSKGVKGIVVELIEGKEGFYDLKTKYRKTINTTIYAGVRETGEFQMSAIEETVSAVERLLNEIYGIKGVKGEDVVIIASSALAGVKNKEVLAQRIKEKTKKELYFMDKEGEILWGIVGSVPFDYIYSSILLDIGSGNTKLGYLEENPFRVVSLEYLYGTVSLTEEAKKQNSSQINYANQTQRIASNAIGKKLKKDVSRYPSFLNRDKIFLVGGIVWAMITLLYPEKQESFVKLSKKDIERFHNMVVTKREKVFKVDLSGIKEEKIRIEAERQIQALKNTFTVDNLIAGSAILLTLSKELNFEKKALYFSREGNWMLGYLIGKGFVEAQKSKEEKQS
ncbi:MAG: tetratricopeptide repeat protein [Thermodesulfobacterium sp.]|nr:tetratricopeptide repeat protein [Thermodesulfobacterium sp.]